MKMKLHHTNLETHVEEFDKRRRIHSPLEGFEVALQKEYR